MATLPLTFEALEKIFPILEKQLNYHMNQPTQLLSSVTLDRPTNGEQSDVIATLYISLHYPGLSSGVIIRVDGTYEFHNPFCAKTANCGNVVDGWIHRAKSQRP